MSKRENKRKFIIAGMILGGSYLAVSCLAKMRRESNGIDDDNPYLNHETDTNQRKQGCYEAYVKSALDKGLSLAGLIVLAPVYAVISAAVYLDDPGPVLFTQKRVGKGGHFFELHKFRTMKMDTPHDVPTHLLKDPDQYITRVGRILRKTSLDELPQIWDIFRGVMSIIGPRPALWNQEDLIAEREKYGANDILPGLTGLAQISGRDELEIAAKAEYDGKYTSVLHAGGIRAALQDLSCFFGTIRSVLRHDGVVEGGTGNAIPAADPADAGFEDYGYKKTFHIDKNAKKKVLITGAGSYVGESFRTYAAEHYPNLSVDVLDMQDEGWREYDFSPYDSVFHVAGIAHADVGKVSEAEKQRYYAVNTDLAIETAALAKESGVRQFILMSSMIIYGDSAPFGKEKVIDEHTVPAPANFYGDSKWQADKGVRKLQDNGFQVAVIRAPMIYGKGSKGNYPVLSKMAKRLPVFPNVRNQRSMLYIENLCEFVSLLVMSGESGVYFPQNGEYSCTSGLVREIGKAAGRNIRLAGWMKPAVVLGSKMPGKIGGMVNKAFGNCVYEQKLSRYEGLLFKRIPTEESIQRSEGEKRAIGKADIDKKDGDKKKHMLVVTQYFYPETFRINDMVKEWVKRGYKVTVLTGIPNYPAGKFYDGYDYRHRRKEQWNGAEIIRIPLIPRGSGSLGLIANYLSFVVSGWLWNVIADIRADFVFTFEVSPMTQALIGCWYRKKYRVPHYLYITDLWPENVESVTGIHNRVVIDPIQKMVDYIYKHTDHIFTCSQSFTNLIYKRGIDSEKIEFWPQYAEEFYQPLERKGQLLPQDDVQNLVFAGNVGVAQGLWILVEAAKRLKEVMISVRFVIIGTGRYLTELQDMIKKEDVEAYFHFIPRQPAEEVPKYLAFADALLIVLSKSNVFSITIPAKTQSCMACGRPILVSADGEVQNIIYEAEAGLCSDAGDVAGLVANIKKLLGMSAEEREKLSFNALLYSERHFDKKQLLDRLDNVFLGRNNGMNRKGATVNDSI